MTTTEAIKRLAEIIDGTQAALTVGFTLAFTMLGLVVLGCWNEMRRNDRNGQHIADIRAHLGIDQEDTVTDPDTDEIPAQPGIPTEPSGIPLQVQSALLRPSPTPRISPADDPEWRRRFGLEVAE